MARTTNTGPESVIRQAAAAALARQWEPVDALALAHPHLIDVIRTAAMDTLGAKTGGG